MESIEFILLKTLINQVGIIVLVAILLSRFKYFRQIITQQRLPFRDIIILTLFFSAFGIFGTYTGIPIKGALANSRVVGVFVGGLIGGPIVGILAGLIAGVHRWGIDIGGFTAFACMIATICEGALAGFLSRKFKKSNKKWLFALVAGVGAEILQMAIILILVTPFYEAWDLVKIISLPMIIANAIGISMFIIIVDWILREHDRIASNQSKTVLLIANKTINLFRKGLNEKTATKAATIIKKMTEAQAVTFTCHDKILAHVGVGSDHHFTGSDTLTGLTRQVLLEGVTRVAYTHEDIDCSEEDCDLRSGVIVPLKEKEKTIGTLKMYKTSERAITDVDIQLAEGLASLFSTQIELARIEEQAKLLKQAELKSLQAQINPHFLFNALNTVASLTRTNSEKARDLLVRLAAYFRRSLYNSEEILLTEEITNIKNYLEIEKARFGDTLKIDFDISENLDCKIPPFTIQPIVENALKHGLLNRVGGGSITISANLKNKNIVITVKDDGVGIDDTKLRLLLDEGHTTKSVGLKNVHRRLVHRYGELYGLTIKSVKGQGTTVQIKIPGGH